MNLTKNFSLIELVSSETATRRNIDNTPNSEVIYNLALVCINVMQPIRDWYGQAINITSGYRSPKLNKAIGGSLTSDHCYGRAIDFTVPKHDFKKVFEFIKSNLQFDQLIWEFGDDIAPNWIHVSYRESGNRKQVLKAVKQNGVTKYLNM